MTAVTEVTAAIVAFGLHALRASCMVARDRFVILGRGRAWWPGSTAAVRLSTSTSVGARVRRSPPVLNPRENCAEA